MEIHRKVRLNCGFREDLLRPSLVSLSLGIVKLIVANFLVLFARKMMEGLYIYMYIIAFPRYIIYVWFYLSVS